VCFFSTEGGLTYNEASRGYKHDGHTPDLEFIVHKSLRNGHHHGIFHISKPPKDHLQSFQCQIKLPSPREDQNSLKLELNMKNMQIGIRNVQVLVLHLLSLLNVLKTTPKALSLFIVSIYKNQLSISEHLMKHCSKIMMNYMMICKERHTFIFVSYPIL
jgi:hypothetical protein